LTAKINVQEVHHNLWNTTRALPEMTAPNNKKQWNMLGPFPGIEFEEFLS